MLLLPLMLFLAASPPVTEPTTPILYVVGMVFAGGIFMVLFQIYMRWRRGPIEDTELASRIARSANADMKDILGEYRVELEVVKRQVEDYREQLYRMTSELANATIRISQLEAKLDTAVSDREQLRAELRAAVEDRGRLLTEISLLKQRLASYGVTNLSEPPAD